MGSARGEPSSALAAELLEIAETGLRTRYYRLLDSKPLECASREDGLPELESFEHKWKLRFPVPPSVCLPLEELMTGQWTRPVKILEGTRQRLKLTVNLAVGRNIILEFVRGALDQCNPKRKRGKWMVGRTVSRKRGLQLDVPIVRTADNQLEMTIPVPADKEKVCKLLHRRRLPRAIASLRSREDYIEVFKVQDLHAESKRSIAEEMNYDSPSAGGAIRVRDRLKTFEALLQPNRRGF
jgi:hypothetical protein